MKHLLFVTLALLVGCSGAGTGGGGLTPSVPSSGVRSPSSVTANPHRRFTRIRWRMTIPRRHRGAHALAHPSTISPLTQSVSIAVDSLAPKIFNTTPSSPGCSAGASGTTCTFALDAPVGSDTIAVTTYGAAGGGNPMLDYGIGVFTIKAGAANAVTIALGPVVSSANDSGVGSLRYAVGSASPGDTILFLLPTGSVITLLSAITIADRISIAGPGSDVTISGGGTQQLFVVESGATASITGLTLTRGATPTALQPGGDINNQGTLSVNDDVFSDSVSTVSSSVVKRSRDVQPTDLRPHLPCILPPPPLGGAIYSSGTLDVSDSTFEGNTVASKPVSCFYGEGGAIANLGGTLTVTGSTFADNGAFRGGAIFNGGPATLANDTFSGNTGCTATLGCPSTGCTGTGCTYGPGGFGAAIFDESGPGISISGSTFENNVAGGDGAGSEGQGGAVAVGSGSPTISGSTFVSNLAGGSPSNCGTGKGGAIYAGASANLILSGNTFSGNEATGDETADGGAIYAAGSVHGGGDSFETNQAIASGSPCAIGAAEGGAIYVNGSSQFERESLSSNAAVAQGIGGGSPSSFGGAIYNSASLSLSGNAFSGNVTASGGSAPGNAFGGAVFTNAALTSTGDTFASNVANASSGSGGQAEGGALFLSGVLTATGDTISSNTATAGGGIGLGGAIGNDIAGSTLSGCTLDANRATSTAAALGGAVFDTDGMTIAGSTLSGNSATLGGGAVFAGAAETIENSTISANSVTAASSSLGGGGIFGNAALTLAGSTISGNAVTVTGATAGGGGIFNNGGLAMTGSTVSGNAVYGSAAGSGGGGIYNYDDATISNSTIDGNLSQIDGGGFEAYQGALPPFTVTLTNVTMYGNAATGTGGNIDDPGIMTMTNTIVAGGSATVGLDIDNAGTLTSGDYNIVATVVSGTPLSGATAFDQTVNPALLALTNNGGPTFTNADQAGGPGTAHVPFSGGNCGPGGIGIDVDQRGFARGAGGFCDVGAFELGGVPTAIEARIPTVHPHRHPISIARWLRRASPK